MSTQFSPVLSVLHAGSCRREEPGPGKQGWAEDGSPQCAGEQLRACVWSELSLCSPATCGPDVVWGKVQPWSRDLLGFKKQPPPSAISPSPPLLPHAVWAKFSLTVKSFPREVIWTDCLLLNYQQSSWAWLNV